MAAQYFLARHEFFVRRLHSITGVVPVGAYMLVHLVVNASLLSAPSTFQKNVYQIHSLESLLPIVEWLFVLLPILFHAVLGVVIIRSGQANTSMYPFAANIRYTLQRATGIIAFAFILWHVFHMHGWLHFDAWHEHVVKPLNGAVFKPFNAASTLGLAMSNPVVLVLYAVGVLSCVYHLANGLWTMGITWGLWTSVGAQRRASQLCAGFGVGLAILVVGVLYGAATVDIRAAKETEDRMYEAMVESKEIRPNPEKRSEMAEPSAQRGGPGTTEVAGTGTR
jgi:succinate dehydrogenase / fumarate reductase cytochrome b subunit